MSRENNRDTLDWYIGQVWLTRPRPAGAAAEGEQWVNICVEQGGDFVALDRLTLSPAGVYAHKGKPIGRKEDEAFRRFIEKLAGARGKSEGELFEQVCAVYEQQRSLKAAAEACGISRERVRRILITRGLYSNSLIESILWLYDEGKGKSVREIADILKLSEDAVTRNLPYRQP